MHHCRNLISLQTLFRGRRECIDLIDEDPLVSAVSDEGDGIIWKYDGEAGVEYNRIVSVEGTEKTYVLIISLLENGIDEQQVDAAVESLTLTVK